MQFLANQRENLRMKEEKVDPPVRAADGVPKAVATDVRRPEDQHDLETVYRAAIVVSEGHQGIFHLMEKPVARRANDEREVLMFHQPPPNETRHIAQKIEELEGNQALEKDRLVTVNKNIDAKFGELENLMKSMLSATQNQTNERPQQRWSGANFGSNSEGALGKPGSSPRWGKPHDRDGCFYCGTSGHFIPDCDELKDDIHAGHVKVNPDGKLRLGDGSRIPMGAPGSTIKERIEKAMPAVMKSAYLNGFYENEDGLYIPAMARYVAQNTLSSELPEKRRRHLEQELDIKEKEEALELRKLKLEREEKRLETSAAASRNVNVQGLLEQLTDDEVAAIKAAKGGFP